MRVVLDEGARLPEYAHENDAGMDLFSRETVTIPARGSYVFNTSVHMEIPDCFAGFIKSKSGLNVKHGITSDGLAPVVHGRWEICSDGYYPYCSVCREEPKSGEMTAFCPSCGAKMDLGERYGGLQ